MRSILEIFILKFGQFQEKINFAVTSSLSYAIVLLIHNLSSFVSDE